MVSVLNKMLQVKALLEKLTLHDPRPLVFAQKILKTLKKGVQSVFKWLENLDLLVSNRKSSFLSIIHNLVFLFMASKIDNA